MGRHDARRKKKHEKNMATHRKDRDTLMLTNKQTMFWPDGPLLGFDCETTGVDPLTCRLVSAAVVLDVPGQEQQSWQWLVNPGMPVPLEATAVHGISTEEAETKGMAPGEALCELVTVLDGIDASVPVVIYNAVYDCTVADRESRRHLGHGFAIDRPILDPLVMDRRLDKWRRGRRTQTAVASAYGIIVSGAHTAIGDVLTSVKLARAIGRKYPHIGSRNPAELQAMQAQAHREFAEHFTEYRRREVPDFVCNADWPVIAQQG